MPTGFQDMKDYADKSVVRKYLRYQNTNFAFNEAEPIEILNKIGLSGARLILSLIDTYLCAEDLNLWELIRWA